MIPGGDGKEVIRNDPDGSGFEGLKMGIARLAKPCVRLICVLCTILLVAACGGMSAFSEGGLVSEENSLSIPDGQRNGRWNARELGVDYRYGREGQNLYLEGTVTFSRVLTYNFSGLQSFQLAVAFLDANGRVLAMQGLMTDRGDFDPATFQKTLALPPGTMSMAFTFQGVALSSDSLGSGGLSSFWWYPIHR